jgi:hypothetical protein
MMKWVWERERFKQGSQLVQAEYSEDREQSKDICMGEGIFWAWRARNFLKSLV